MLREILASKGIDFLKGAYYFGDGAPYTCWDGFREEMVDFYLKKMRVDGFNCVILLVPGSIPELEISNPDFALFFWKSLSTVIRKAQAHGMYVLFRINYAWDRFPAELDRFDLTFRHHLDGSEKARLGNFLTRLYAESSSHKNFLYAFITWEDVTMYFLAYAPNLSLEQRASIARAIGYRNVSATSTGDTEIVPTPADPDFKNFLEFVDNLLVNFYGFAKRSFPALSMEVRCDLDRYYDDEGNVREHVHSKTYVLPEMDIIGTYYGIFMGAGNKREQLSATEAFNNFRRSQHDVLTHPEHPARPLVFIDQFLFCIREHQFSHFAWMDEGTQSHFIDLCAEWMRTYSAGFAIWSFQDYLTDVLSNGAFALGLAGWGHSGLVYESAGAGCIIEAGGAVWQALGRKLPSGIMMIDAEVAVDSEIRVRFSDTSFMDMELCARDSRVKQFREIQGEVDYITLKVLKGKVGLLKIAVGTEIASHGGYPIDFAETAVTTALVKLNMALKSIDRPRPSERRVVHLTAEGNTENESQKPEEMANPEMRYTPEFPHAHYHSYSVSSGYLVDINPILRLRAEDIANVCNRLGARSIMDVGSNLGGFLFFLEQFTGRTDLVGVEGEARFVAECQNVAAMLKSKVRFYHSDIMALESERVYDAMIVQNVYHYIFDKVGHHDSIFRQFARHARSIIWYNPMSARDPVIPQHASTNPKADWQAYGREAIFKSAIAAGFLHPLPLPLRFNGMGPEREHWLFVRDEIKPLRPDSIRLDQIGATEIPIREHYRQLHRITADDRYFYKVFLGDPRSRMMSVRQSVESGLFDEDVCDGLCYIVDSNGSAIGYAQPRGTEAVLDDRTTPYLGDYATSNHRRLLWVILSRMLRLDRFSHDVGLHNVIFDLLKSKPSLIDLETVVSDASKGKRLSIYRAEPNQHEVAAAEDNLRLIFPDIAIEVSGRNPIDVLSDCLLRSIFTSLIDYTQALRNQ